jgi:hypothetical protein
VFWEPFFGFEGPECPETVAVVVAPVWLVPMASVWLVPSCCGAVLEWRVLCAPDHVITPERETRFVAQHAMAASLSDFPLCGGNFGGF